MSENIFFLFIFISFLFSVVQFSMFVMRRIRRKSRSRIDMGSFLKNQRKSK